MLNVTRGRVAPTLLAALLCVGLVAHSNSAKAQTSSNDPAAIGTQGIAFEAGGSFLAMHTLLTAIGNSYERGAMTAAEVEVYAQQVIEAVSDSIRGLEHLRQLPNVNQSAVEQMIRSFQMFSQSAEALILYARSGNTAERDAYVSLRDNGWKSLVTAFGDPSRVPKV